jgi:hypothetical protein
MTSANPGEELAALTSLIANALIALHVEVARIASADQVENKPEAVVNFALRAAAFEALLRHVRTTAEDHPTSVALSKLADALEKELGSMRTDGMSKLAVTLAAEGKMRFSKDDE